MEAEIKQIEVYYHGEAECYKLGDRTPGLGGEMVLTRILADQGTVALRYELEKKEVDKESKNDVVIHGFPYIFSKR